MICVVRGFVRLAVASILLAGASVGQDPAKPRCSARLQGQFWPEQANQDAKLARALSRTGELELCTLWGWRYRWQSVSVHISQLPKKRGKTPAPTSASASTTVPSVN